RQPPIIRWRLTLPLRIPPFPISQGSVGSDVSPAGLGSSSAAPARARRQAKLGQASVRERILPPVSRLVVGV
ncbi:hypothetical protein ACAF96_26750, partial [Escherichia coli]|uniref:hypothetical protein n=1 Tax=Escherichia coli TaxID=562 RepID=UPI003FA12388